MKRRRRDLLLLLPLVALTVLVAWNLRGPSPDQAITVRQGEDPVRVRLVARTASVTPGGRLDLGLDFSLAPGWHLFWKGRSDTGAPIAAEFQLPEGFSTGSLLWPAPERHLAPGGILDHVYHEQVLLVLPVQAPADLPPGGVAGFRCRVNWVACREACRFGEGEVSLSLPVGVRGEPTPALAEALLFERARRRIPRPWPDSPGGPHLEWRGADLVVEVPGAAGLVFYPETDCGPLVDPITDAAADGGRLVLRFGAGEPGPGPASGLLEIRRDDPELSDIFTLYSTRPADGNCPATEKERPDAP